MTSTRAQQYAKVAELGHLNPSARWGRLFVVHPGPEWRGIVRPVRCIALTAPGALCVAEAECPHIPWEQPRESHPLTEDQYRRIGADLEGLRPRVRGA